MTHAPKLRTWTDRLRQIFLFEVGGLLVISPMFNLASGVPFFNAISLLALIAMIAAVWNASFNITFDWIEGSLTGRTADQRKWSLRVVQACSFEGGLFIITWPIIVHWTGMSYFASFWADIGLALAYTAYAFVFNLIYDRLFPILSAQTP